MPCSACDHPPSPGELLREFNPVAFTCPGCGRSLTLGAPGWVILVVLCAAGVALASVSANQYRSGIWSLGESLVVLGAFLIGAFAVELVYVRLARLPLRKQPRDAG